MEDQRNKQLAWLICLGLVLATVAAYAPLWHCGFILLDDYDYVVDNSMVQHGINARSVAWAFTTEHADNWHPLTWISHMVDFRLYGLNPLGHHLTNLFFHAANSLVLFLLLRRMTGALWPAALAASLFALHPMHVESVAWVAERKDVLSTLFWLLTVWTYVRYVQESKTGGPEGKWFYAASVLCFALGLMSKPMLVTLPFVLLLFDFWPLDRSVRPSARWLWEKIPFFVLSGLSCWLTYQAQQHAGAVASLSDLPYGERLKGIPIAYLRYLGKSFWPSRLALFYPVPTQWPAWKAVASAGVLVLVTGWALWRRKTEPWLAVGWFWFLGMLVPVIGLVQVGGQAMADRYSYVPGIGLMVMAIWSVRAWVPSLTPAVAALVGTAVLPACFALTWTQAGYWRDSETVFRHAVEVTDDNGVMEGYLGETLLAEGHVDEALPHLQRGVSGNVEKPGVHNALGRALRAKGRAQEALDQFLIDIKLDPASAVSQYNAGALLLENERAALSVPYLQEALRLRPEQPEFHYKLGNALMQTGRPAEATSQYETALRLRPNFLEAEVNLAWILASSPEASLRDGAKAVRLAAHSDQLAGGKNPKVLGTLAAAYAEAGQFGQAIATVQRALQAAGADPRSPVSGMLRQALALYQSGAPLRDPQLQPEAGVPTVKSN